MDYREYQNEVKSHAAAVFEDYEDHDFRLADRIHEVVDGSQLVIYTAKNLDVLRHSDNQDAYFEDFGQLESAESFGTVMAQLAYYAFQRDIYDQIARWQDGIPFLDIVEYFDFSPYSELFELECEKVTGDATIEILEYGLDGYNEGTVYLFWDMSTATNFGVSRAYLACGRSLGDAYELAINSGKMAVIDPRDIECGDYADDMAAYERGECTRLRFNDEGQWIDTEWINGAEVKASDVRGYLVFDE